MMFLRKISILKVNYSVVPGTYKLLSNFGAGKPNTLNETGENEKISSGKSLLIPRPVWNDVCTIKTVKDNDWIEV